MTKLQIGDKEVAFTATLIIPNGAEAIISEPIAGWNAKFKLIFQPSKDGKDASYLFKPENDELVMTFTGWESPFGLALEKPVKVGAFNDGRIIGVMIYHQKVGNVSKVLIQFLVGGVYA